MPEYGRHQSPLEQLIKSKLLSVHRRAQQSTAGTILRIKAKTVPTGQKQIGAKTSKSLCQLAPNKTTAFYLKFVWGLR
jgi:hypothetical protein